jgi:hypothetical protein
MHIHAKKERVIYLTRCPPTFDNIYKKQEIFITITLGEVKTSIRLQSFWPIRYQINEI